MCWKCNTLNELFNQICVRNRTEDLNISMFNIITGINESKTLTRHISCECKYKFDERKYIQINGGMTINIDVSVKNVYVKKNYVWIPATCSSENGGIFRKHYEWFSDYVSCEVLELYDEETKTCEEQIVMKRKQPVNAKSRHFTRIFY